MSEQLKQGHMIRTGQKDFYLSQSYLTMSPETAGTELKLVICIN